MRRGRHRKETWEGDTGRRHRKETQEMTQKETQEGDTGRRHRKEREGREMRMGTPRVHPQRPCCDFSLLQMIEEEEARERKTMGERMTKE